MATKLNVFAAVAFTGEFAVGSVCQACTFDLATGDSGETERDMQAVEKNCAAWHFTLGHDHKSVWIDSNTCYHHGADCEDFECRCDTEDFSNSACSMCDTTLAGYRNSVTMVNRDLIDNTRMTQEQFDKLRDLCHRYNVPMAISDYAVNSPDLGMNRGWIESWVGGAANKGKTIFVGVSPDGDSHS